MFDIKKYIGIFVIIIEFILTISCILWSLGLKSPINNNLCWFLVPIWMTFINFSITSIAVCVYSLVLRFEWQESNLFKILKNIYLFIIKPANQELESNISGFAFPFILAIAILYSNNWEIILNHWHRHIHIYGLIRVSLLLLFSAFMPIIFTALTSACEIILLEQKHNNQKTK